VARAGARVGAVGRRGPGRRAARAALGAARAHPSRIPQGPARASTRRVAADRRAASSRARRHVAGDACDAANPAGDRTPTAARAVAPGVQRAGGLAGPSSRWRHQSRRSPRRAAVR
jgi:hypothetical protein